MLINILGYGSSLQSGFYYKYKYKGRVGASIPQLRSQTAATEIKADLEIYMLSNNFGSFQLRHLEVGFINEDEEGFKNISYKSLLKNIDLEKIFFVHLSAEEVSKRSL